MSRVLSPVFVEELLRAARFPLWWYTDGFRAVREWCAHDLRMEWRSMGIRLWMQALFRPMYGAYDVWGRIVSFCMRVVIITARTFWWMMIALVYAVALITWCLWIPLALALLFV
ncbi:hypothetical protein KBD13_01910 [Patescibacteria group bacterium]|nr:hypothetical protein [Patescibacteria group bacterium]MDQ5919340.1 hypothetical protein [Patescibacteria group bacterium]